MVELKAAIGPMAIPYKPPQIAYDINDWQNIIMNVLPEAMNYRPLLDHALPDQYPHSADIPPLGPPEIF